MIGNNDKITKGQNAGLIIGSVFGVGILSLPSDLAKDFGSDGIMMLIIGSVLTILLVMIHTKLTLKFTGKTVVEIMDALIPKPIGVLFSIIFILFYIFSAASVVRISSEIVKMFLLQNTPLEVIIITMLISNVYIARKGIETIARLVQIIFPLAIIPFFILLLAIVPDLDFTNIYPIFQVGPMDIAKGIKVVMFSFIGTEIILISTAYLNDTKKVLRYNILSVVFLAVIYITIFIVVLTQFGRIQTMDLLWPTLFLMKTVDVPGTFLENVDGVVIGLWTFLTLQSLAIILMQGSVILSKSLKLKETNFMSMPLLPIIYILALVPENIAAAYEYIGLFSNYFGTAIAIVIPILLFSISLFKKKKGANKA
ncbi:endospore germination permease [Clostridium sp. D2Q-11]|uniref:Endospore germination permease n=1 Tax=Anaeromonas frigoriresistens TaxID=2683708 RepID=A0A942Z541_9FIRM|nr:endospore germination permease [Anaeromonas frigoriresistens]MBS4537021.1 endospore germination permease [Anaeromonas frigoriresistens]